MYNWFPLFVISSLDLNGEFQSDNDRFSTYNVYTVLAKKSSFICVKLDP